MQHGNGVWAPSIRYHNNEFYIYYGDPDFGIYMTKAKKVTDRWSPLTLVKAGKGLLMPVLSGTKMVGLMWLTDMQGVVPV